MSFTIGIGVLLEPNANNRLRKIELLCACASGNWSALSQPPHITVKAPFEVESMSDIENVLTLTQELAERTKSFDVNLDGYSSFSDRVLYGVVKEAEHFLLLSNRLIDALAKSEEQRAYERGRIIFHSTLAMNLSSQEYELAFETLRKESLNMATSATGLGLFMRIEASQNWVLINQASFLHD